MKRFLLMLIILSAVAFASAPTTNPCSGDCTSSLGDFRASFIYSPVESRISIIDLDPESLIDEEIVQISSDWQDFIFAYNAITGKVSFTVGNKTVDWDYQTGLAFDHLLVHATGLGTTEVRDLKLNGNPLPDNSFMSVSGVKIYIPWCQMCRVNTITGQFMSSNEPSEAAVFSIYGVWPNTNDYCPDEVPEFGLVGTLIALAGIGLFIYKKR